MKLLLFLFISLVPLNIILSQKEEPNGKFSGYMFGDYFYNISRDTAISSIPNKALNGAKDLNGFQIRKIYFTYDSDISARFAARFRLEADQEIKLPNGKIGVAVKDAYLKWKDIFAGSDFYFGLQPTPAFYTIVDFWGYRLIEKAPIDLRGLVPSRDIAVSLKGKIDHKGIFNYWFLIGNGKGNSTDIDKYRRLYAHIHIIPSKSFKIIVYQDVKFQRALSHVDVNNNEAELNNNIYTTDLFLGYSYNEISRTGVEAYLQQTKNGYSFINKENMYYKNKNTIGFSLFEVYNFNQQFSVIGRYDYFDNNAGSESKGDSRNYFMFGVSYRPDPDVSITPNILIESYERMPSGQTYNKSVTARITFFYNYL